VTLKMTSDEKRALELPRIGAAEHFEKNLDSDSTNVIADLSAKTNIEKTRLAQLLADSLQETGKPLKRDLSDHWLDVFSLAILAVVVLLVGRPWWFPPNPETRLRAAEDISAFTVITEKQLKVEGPATPTQQSAMKQPFVGKYSAELIRKDGSLPDKIAGYEKVSFAGRMILRLQVKEFPSLEGRPYPQNIELVFASRNSSPSAFMVPALLLASDVPSHAVTVALLPHDAQLATAWTGSSDVNVVWRSP